MNKTANSTVADRERLLTPNGIATTPQFGTVRTWCALTGMGHTATYAAMGRGELPAIKLGRRTLIDIEAGLSWLRAQTPWKPGVGDRSDK